tara:strand:- start:7739 stop:9673 length:1935 start_codon:yes stop_codon:yes gene_type:complete
MSNLKIGGKQIRFDLSSGAGSGQDFQVTNGGEIQLLDDAVTTDHIAGLGGNNRVLTSSGAIIVELAGSGAGYSNNANGTFTVSGGSSAAGTLKTNASGQIEASSIVMTNNGSGYGYAGAVAVTVSGLGTPSSDATFNIKYLVGASKVRPDADPGDAGVSSLAIFAPSTNATNITGIGTQQIDLDMGGSGGQRITNLAGPVDGTDLATKTYVDGIVSSSTLLWKPPCQYVYNGDTTATLSGDNMTIATTVAQIDGASVQNNDRVLFPNMTTAPHLNGIWKCNRVFENAKMDIQLDISKAGVNNAQDVEDACAGLIFTLVSGDGTSRTYTLRSTLQAGEGNGSQKNGGAASERIVDITAAGTQASKGAASEHIMSQFRTAVEDKDSHGDAFQISPEAGDGNYRFKIKDNASKGSANFSVNYSGSTLASDGETFDSAPSFANGDALRFERPDDSSTKTGIMGSSVSITEGSFFQETFWHCSTDSIGTLDASGAGNAIAFVQRNGISQASIVTDSGLEFPTALSVGLKEDDVRRAKLKAKRLHHTITATDLLNANLNGNGDVKLVEARTGWKGTQGQNYDAVLLLAKEAFHQVYLNGVLLEHANNAAGIGTNGDFFIEESSTATEIDFHLDIDLVYAGDILEIRYLAS